MKTKVDLELKPSGENQGITVGDLRIALANIDAWKEIIFVDEEYVPLIDNRTFTRLYEDDSDVFLEVEPYVE